MDAQSNSSKQDSAGRPSNTPNLSFEPRRMSVSQKALAPFAYLRPIQQQYGPSSAEAFGAQQQAEQTVQHYGYTEDQNDGSAHAQKDTSSSSQTPGAQKPQAKHLTRFEVEYNARRLAAAIEGPKFDNLLSQAQNQTQSTSEKTENPAPAQTRNTCQLTIQTSNQESQVDAKEGPSLSNLAVQHPIPTQDQNDLEAQTQKDTSRSSDTYKTKTVPDVQRKIKNWELSMAKTQFEEWNDIPNTWNLAIEMEFERRLQDFTKSQGVELQDVVFTPIRFCKSRAEAQAHYETLLAEFRNAYKTRQVAAAVAQAKVDHQVQAPKQVSSQAQNPIQSSPEMPKNPMASAQNQAPPQDPAQTQSTSEMIENPAPAQTQDTCQLKTQVSNQKGQVEVKKETASSNLPMRCSESQNSTKDNISDQTQKGTSQHPADSQKVPQAEPPAQAMIQAQPSSQTVAQPLAQAAIQTETRPQAKSQTPHSKLAFVQSTAKLNEVALAKVQVDFYNECNPEYWARMEKHFVKRIEAIAKSHGVDPRDVVINSVPLAKSQAEAQAQYKTLYNMAREAGHSNIVAEHTASEITSQKGCLTQDNLLNQIALLKMELAETKGSQDQTFKDFNAKSEMTRLEHLKQVDYLQKRIKMGQVENQLLSSKLSKEQSTSERLRASLEESEKEVERLKKVLKAKSEQKVRVPLPLETAQLPNKSTPEVKRPVSPTVSQIIALNKEMADEQAKANAQRHAEILAAIQTTVQESFKAAAENKVKVEAEEKAKIEAKAQIYAQAYVKAKTEAKAKTKAKARAETEAKNKTQAKPLYSPKSSSCPETLPDAQSQIQIKNLQKVIDQLIKSYRNTSEKYQEQIRCLEHDIQELTEETDYKIEDLKKEVDEKDDKILELQKELWKVIDERQEARLDAEKLEMQLCTNNW